MIIKAKKASITDVAREAGVSIATVSRYFNNAEQVSLETRRKIAKVVEMLDYRSSQTARKKSNLIALITRNMSNPNYIQFFKTAENLADERGYVTAYFNAAMSPERERKLYEQFADLGVAGVIAFTIEENDENLNILEQGGIPVVLMDSTHNNTHHNVLANLITNVYSGAYKGTGYLLSIGHRQIAFLAGTTNIYTGKSRLQGYLDALRDFDPSIQPQYYSLPFSEEAGYLQTVQLLLYNKSITAIFPASNQLTTGCFRALQDYNINVPGQISLLGFDDIGHTQLYNPPLTVVSRPTLHRAGFSAMSILLDHIEQKASFNNQANISMDMPMEILVRQSCAPPNNYHDA